MLTNLSFLALLSYFGQTIQVLNVADELWTNLPYFKKVNF